VIAAQSIGEPGTQLTMRTFHIGGAASRAAVASSSKPSQRYRALHATMRYVTNAKGEQIVISRSGEVLITDDTAASASVTRSRTARRCCSSTVRRSRPARSWQRGTR
jgi:phage gp45-like